MARSAPFKPTVLIVVVCIVTAIVVGALDGVQETRDTDAETDDMSEQAPMSLTASQLRQALDRQIDVDIDRLPLKLVIESTVAEQGILVRFDETAFNDDIFTEPVTMHLKQIALRDVMSLLLVPRGGAYVENRGTLLVTSESSAAYMLETHFYRLPDLVDTLGPIDIDSMIDLIETLVVPDSWESLGGPGSITGVEEGLWIRQSQAVHRQIRQLYQQIDRFLAEMCGCDYPAQPGDPASAQDLAISLRLEQPVNVDFVDTPLVDALHELANRCRINIWLDEQSLSDEGISPDSPISFSVEEISLKAALRTMLSLFQLNSVVKDGVLIVTTSRMAEEMIVTRIYDVRRIVPDDDYDELIDLITTVVSPDTWPEGTGPGPVQGFAWMLAMEQTQSVHAEIAQLLFDIQRIRTTPRIQRPAPMPSNRQRRAEARFQQVLSKNVNLVVEDEPLIDVLEMLARSHHFQIWLDEIPLFDEGISPDSPVSITASGVTLESCLQTILKPLDLVAIYDNEQLRITTRRIAEEEFTIRVYDVVDLAEKIEPDPAAHRQRHNHQRQGGGFQGDGFRGQGQFQVGPDDFQGGRYVPPVPIVDPPVDPVVQEQYRIADATQQIADTLRSDLAIETWDGTGGYGSVQTFQDMLVVRQTEEVHKKIVRRLQEMRRTLVDGP